MFVLDQHTGLDFCNASSLNQRSIFIFVNQHEFNTTSHCSYSLITCARGDTTNTVISCKKYTDLRNELMYTINYPVTIDLNLLLKGSDTLSVDQNIDIFIKVQNFILKSKKITS